MHEQLPSQQPVTAPPLAPTPPTHQDPAAVAPPHPSKSHVSPGLIVLQWLTYAFWGWTVVALASMVVNVVSYFVAEGDAGDFTPFGIAALLVLLPLSVVCDHFYAKRETVKKSGPPALVMIIHAVVFALLGIGSIIAFVFTLVMMFTSGKAEDTHFVALISSIIIAVLYGATFVRTLNPLPYKKFVKLYIPFMTVVVGIIIALAIMGPVVSERQSKNDRIVESGIGNLAQEINNYANTKDELPDSLSQIETAELNDDAKDMIAQKLVEYHPNTDEPSQRSTGNTYGNNSLDNALQSEKTFYYELCATFKSSQGYSGERSSYSTYETYPSAYSHSRGRVCYKVKTRY